MIENPILNSALQFLRGIGLFIWKAIHWHYLLYGVLLLITVYFCRWLIREYRSWNRGWLSYLIKEEISKATRKKDQKPKRNYRDLLRLIRIIRLYLMESVEKIDGYFRNKVSYDIKQLYLPSLTSLCMLLIVFILLFVIGHSNVPYQSAFNAKSWSTFALKNIEANELSRAVSILAGFVSIVFALV